MIMHAQDKEGMKTRGFLVVGDWRSILFDGPSEAVRRREATGLKSCRARGIGDRIERVDSRGASRGQIAQRSFA